MRPPVVAVLIVNSSVVAVGWLHYYEVICIVMN